MTIKEAVYSINHIIDLSEYVSNGKSLIMIKDFDTIRFIYDDLTIQKFEEKNTMVYENEKYSIKTEYITNNTVKAISYPYPYYYKNTSDRIVAETCGFFLTGDYTLIKGGQERVIDYNKVEDLIYKTIKQFKNK